MLVNRWQTVEFFPHFKVFRISQSILTAAKVCRFYETEQNCFQLGQTLFETSATSIYSCQLQFRAKRGPQRTGKWRLQPRMWNWNMNKFHCLLHRLHGLSERFPHESGQYFSNPFPPPCPLSPSPPCYKIPLGVWASLPSCFADWQTNNLNWREKYFLIWAPNCGK